MQAVMNGDQLHLMQYKNTTESSGVISFTKFYTFKRLAKDLYLCLRVTM